MTTAYIVTVQGCDWYELRPVVHLRYQTALAEWHSTRLSLIDRHREFIGYTQKDLAAETNPEHAKMYRENIERHEAEILRLENDDPATCEPRDLRPTIEEVEVQP